MSMETVESPCCCCSRCRVRCGSYQRDLFALLLGATAAADSQRAAKVLLDIARRFHLFGSYHQANLDASADNYRYIILVFDALVFSLHLPPQQRQC